MHYVMTMFVKVINTLIRGISSKIDWPLNLKNSCLTVTLSQNMNVKSLFKILNSFLVQ